MEKLRIYLDNCCFNRPYDDQDMLSVFLETQAKLSIQELVRTDELSLVWSTILDYENSRNPDDVIRDEISTWRKVSSIIIHRSESIIKNAVEINKSGIDKKDSLHIACAIDAKTDFFITTDKGIIRKRNFITGINIVNPVDFISILEDKNESR